MTGIGGLVASIFQGYIAGTYWTLVGLVFIIAGVGYNIQAEIRKKNQPTETLEPSNPSGAIARAKPLFETNDHKLIEVAKVPIRSAYDQKPTDSGQP